MLNTIWCVSPINETTGGTEFLLGSQHSEAPPSGEEFDKKHMVIDANPGDVVMFDSRVWHRAGSPKQGVEERIIFTPIYSRPFIKPGFDYVKSMEKSENLEEAPTLLKQLCGYYSDIPKSHTDWYSFNERRFYHKDQDL